MIMLEFIHALSTAVSRRNHHLLLAAGDDSGLRDIRELIGSRRWMHSCSLPLLRMTHE
jgi:hypothetical protein